MPINPTVPSHILRSVHALPPLPVAVTRLLTLARNPNVAFSEIIQVIESDQTLTARTLRAANSSLYGISRRVQTVQQAVVLLGRNTITNMALGVSVMSAQADARKEWPIDASAFARHSIAVATMARALADHLGLPHPEEAFVAGLLHDIGKLVLLDYDRDLYSGMLQAAQRGQKPLHRLEQSIFKTDHSAVGYVLCTHWNIPAALARAVAEHHADVYPAAGSIACAVRDANELVKSVQIGDGGNAYAELHPSPEVAHRHVAPDQLRKLLLALPGKVKEIEGVFGASSVPDAPEVPLEGRPRVYLQLAVPEQQELTAHLLLSMGYRPVVVDSATATPDSPEDRVPLGGFISDAPETTARQIAYQQQGIPVLNFAAWRGGNPQIASGLVNIARLQAWLDKGLARPTRSVPRAA